MPPFLELNWPGLKRRLSSELLYGHSYGLRMADMAARGHSLLDLYVL